MNVLSLFDGISCGQIALERADIKIDKYFASEIDKYAIQITQKNFPNTIQLGDITKWKEWSIDWASIDLVIGGSPCFKAGTKVITNNGYKNIEYISIGDMVLTHKNRFQKVVRIGGSIKTIYELKAQGILPLYTTHNHPFYVKTMEKIWSNKNRRYERVFSEAKWKEANNLQKNDFLGIPINNICDNKENITEDEAFILGRYIADGHTRKDYRISENRPNHRQWQLILSIGKNKIDDFNSKCKIKHSCYSHTQSTYRCVFSSKRLVELAENHCGVGAINKYISQTLLNLPINILNELINGYMSGDGSVKDDVYKASTISRELAMSLCLAVAKVYKVNTNIIFTKRPNKCIIEGRVVNQNDTYTIEFRKEWKKQSNAKLINDIIWLPLKSVICLDKKEQVYNLEVEEDNSYTANNCIVHNCQSFSVAGNQSGFNGKSGLFFDFADIYHNVLLQNPNVFFLLENVVMKKEWQDVISKIMGVQPIMINSALVSAQQRKRLYWTNIPNIEQPNDKNILLKDILEEKVEDKYFVSDFIQNRLQLRDRTDNSGVIGTTKPNFRKIGQRDCVYGLDGKMGTLMASDYKQPKQILVTVNNNPKVRKLTPIECERLQTLPDNYTEKISNTQRYKAIGNGWTVDVIAHIFKYIKQ